MITRAFLECLEECMHAPTLTRVSNVKYDAPLINVNTRQAAETERMQALSAQSGRSRPLDASNMAS